MLQLLASAVGTVVSVLIGVAAVGIVVAVVGLPAGRRKQGKGGCDCGCDGCPGCSACHGQSKTHSKK